ncbi:MAG: hypothetical protein A2516_08165 [Alphaproteobacteria bacterium RIFOXYD12_FULL_60_8]|nr:MAG: hypothetical protein A2516_08165 [Alphaproteobacteria bacterium RIFOXYD12_FULL_60_8]
MMHDPKERPGCWATEIPQHGVCLAFTTLEQRDQLQGQTCDGCARVPFSPRRTDSGQDGKDETMTMTLDDHDFEWIALARQN